jgi:hypothetical protein
MINRITVAMKVGYHESQQEDTPYLQISHSL